MILERVCRCYGWDGWIGRNARRFSASPIPETTLNYAVDSIAACGRFTGAKSATMVKAMQQTGTVVMHPPEMGIKPAISMAAARMASTCVSETAAVAPASTMLRPRWSRQAQRQQCRENDIATEHNELLWLLNSRTDAHRVCPHACEQKKWL
jgi:hypothetical protein